MSALSSFRRRLMAGSYPKEQPNYLCFTALEDGTFTLTIPGGVGTTDLQEISYSTDNGSTWVTTANSSSAVTITTPTINAGDSVLWKGKGRRVSNNTYANNRSKFSSTGKFDVSGILVSLIFDDFSEDSTISQQHAFSGLFQQSQVVNADRLIFPTNITDHCYRNTFDGCTYLVNASFEIESNAFGQYCCYYMFNNCASLKNAPKIVCTSGSFGNSSMERFAYNCVNLDNIDEFNAVSVGSRGFYQAFCKCSKLVNAPMKSNGLSLTTYSLAYMYDECSLLADTNLFSITSMGSYGCCTYMFRNCTSLINVRFVLPMTSITATDYYSYMLYGCSSLLSSPVLPCLALTQSAYSNMFMNCTSLNYIKMYATDISGNYCLSNWVNGVQTNSGVFVKHIDATWTTTGNSGVPTNWTVIYYDPAIDKYYLDQQRSQECDDHGNPI